VLPYSRRHTLNEPHAIAQRVEERQRALILLNGFLIPRQSPQHARAPGTQIGGSRRAFIVEQGKSLVQVVECLFVSGCPLACLVTSERKWTVFSSSTDDPARYR